MKKVLSILFVAFTGISLFAAGHGFQLKKNRTVQNENSKITVSSDSKNFKSDFINLFKPNPYSDSICTYLVLVNDEKDKCYFFYASDGVLCGMEITKLYSALNYQKAKKQISDDYGWSTDLISLVCFDMTEALQGAKYIVVDYFWGGPGDNIEKEFSIEDGKILQTSNVQYAERTIETLVKIDGNDVFINGVKYTVVDPKNYVVARFDF